MIHKKIQSVAIEMESDLDQRAKRHSPGRSQENQADADIEDLFEPKYKPKTKNSPSVKRMEGNQR
jgi:hypothetical protein